MKKDRFRKSIAFNILLLGLFSTIIPTLLFSVWDGILIALFLLVFFNLFLRGYDKLIFSLSFGLYLLNSTFFLIATNFIFGSPFLEGGDDKFFYLAGKQLYNSGYDIQTEVDGIPLWAANYPAYLYIISFYYGVLSWLGFNSLHFYHLTLLKISFGALIPVLINKIGNRYNIGFSKNSLLVIILFPPLVIQTSSFLRDSLISFFFILGAYIVTKNLNNFYKLFWILILSSIIYFFRPAHSVFLIFLYVTHMLFLSKKYIGLKFSILGFTLLMLFVVFKQGYGDLIEQFEKVQNLYTDLSLETNSEGSLGLKLYSSDLIVLLPFKLIYYFISPIPPPIFSKMNILSAYLSIGAISWYLIVFAFLKSIFRKVNKSDPFFISIYFLFILAGVIGISTSKDPRHLTFIYPLIIPYGLRELSLINKNQMFIILILSIILGFLLYISLKF